MQAVDCREKQARVHVVRTVDDRGVRPYIGHWQLQGDRHYSACFFIVRGFGEGEDVSTGKLVARHRR
jgi:hypothetical protein